MRGDVFDVNDFFEEECWLFFEMVCNVIKIDEIKICSWILVIKNGIVIDKVFYFL